MLRIDGSAALYVQHLADVDEIHPNGTGPGQEWGGTCRKRAACPFASGGMCRCAPESGADPGNGGRERPYSPSAYLIRAVSIPEAGRVPIGGRRRTLTPKAPRTLPPKLPQSR